MIFRKRRVDAPRPLRVDGAGNVQRTYAYDPDGNASSSGSGPDSWKRYAGGHLIGTTGLYHFANRYYSPVEARWTQQDPIDQPFDLLQANKYAYVGNNPINSADPSGLLTLSASTDVAGIGVGVEIDNDGGVAVSASKGVGVGGGAKLSARGGKVSKSGLSASASACVGDGVVGCASTDGKHTSYSVGVGSPSASVGVTATKRLR